MTENEIKQGLLQVCKVAGWDGDFNVVGFHALCDKLKELGAAAEREHCLARADIALLGSSIELRNRVLHALRTRKQS